MRRRRERLSEVPTILPTVRSGTKAELISAHQNYIAAEHPARGQLFWTLAATFRERTAAAPLAQADLFSYLGKPDLYCTTNEIVQKPGQPPTTNQLTLLAYLFVPAANTNKWAATAVVDEGGVQDIGFSDASRLEQLGFRPFPGAPSRQDGANGRQPPR